MPPTFACVACLAGIPLEAHRGRWAWDAALRWAYPQEPTVSAAAVALITVAMLLVTNLIALAPASIARSTKPADALHAE